MFSRISSISIVNIMLIGLVGVLQATAATEEEMNSAWQGVEAAFNAHDVDQWLSYFTDDAVFDYVPAPPPMEGKEAMRAFMTKLFQAFPDIHADTQRVFTSGNILVNEHINSGTQQGEWAGIPPTGKSGQVPHFEILEFEGDKIKRISTYLDNVTVLVQLGVMPASELPELVPSFTLPDPEPTGLAPLEADAELVSRFNSHDLSALAQMEHRDAETRFNTLGMVPLNREQHAALRELFLLSNSTLRGEVVRRIDMGDGWVLTELVYSGVHDGPYFGIPASGNPIVTRAAYIAHYDADGLLTNQNFYFDNLSALTQIGAFPPLPPLPEYPPIPDYLVQDKITSPSLEGNPLGDPATRDVLIYLPPSYETSPDKRYPTIYLLHGYTGDHRLFVFTLNVAMQSLTGIDLGVDIGDIVNSLMAAGDLGEVIIVMPDAKNAYGGSMYERSELIGDYRNYIARDLVSYIDGKYRTIADREHRAIAGHSMGGYGALSLAIEYPDVFGSVAALSPWACGIEAEPTQIDLFIEENPNTLGVPIIVSTDDDMWKLSLTKFWTNLLYAWAAAWTPNLDNPPYYVDLPIKYPEKTIVQDVWEKWLEHDLVSQIERDGANLSNTPIFIDRGVGETVILDEAAGIDRLPAALDAQGISYTYDEFDGDHLTHLRYQLESALKFLYPHIAPVVDKEAVRELARRGFEEIWNQKNLGAIDELMSPDFLQHQPAGIGDMVGTTAFKQFVASYLIAWPDVQYELHDIIVEGDLAAIRWTAHASHQGPFMGVPPSGKEGPGTTGITITRFENDKQVESWNEWDALGLMGWLGLIPTDHEPFLWGEPVPITGDPGDPEANKAVVMRYAEEVWNQHRLESIDELFHPEAISHDPNVSPMADLTLQKQITALYFAAFPDLHVTVDNLIAEGDRVVARWTTTGTHQGDYFGIPPTGNRVELTGMTVYRLADGKIAETWWAYDALGILQQLGAIPTGPPEDFSNVFFLSLEQGLNMVSLPLKPITPYTARSFAEELGATAVIQIDAPRQRFVGWTPDAPDDGFAIEGGQGYIVNTPQGGMVAFTGAAWTNLPPAAMAAPTTAPNSAWAFVVNAQLEHPSWSVRITNGSTGAILRTEGEHERVSGVWADLNRQPVVHAGDVLEVVVSDASGLVGRLRYQVRPEDLGRAYVTLPVTLAAMRPEASRLLPNYPNPFNPETWVPYELAAPGEVRVRIFDAQGRLVRTLSLGHQPAGYYVSPSRAAYWDGRNERGERVSSGVYVVTLEAGDFTATRRMVLVK